MSITVIRYQPHARDQRSLDHAAERTGRSMCDNIVYQLSEPVIATARVQVVIRIG